LSHKKVAEVLVKRVNIFMEKARIVEKEFDKETGACKDTNNELSIIEFMQKMKFIEKYALINFCLTPECGIFTVSQRSEKHLVFFYFPE
jgi:hypothetical protein